MCYDDPETIRWNDTVSRLCARLEVATKDNELLREENANLVEEYAAVYRRLQDALRNR